MTTAPSQSAGDVLLSRRSVVVPPDLFRALDVLARRDGFDAVPPWCVVQLQKLASWRASELPVWARAKKGP